MQTSPDGRDPSLGIHGFVRSYSRASGIIRQDGFKGFEEKDSHHEGAVSVASPFCVSIKKKKRGNGRCVPGFSLFDIEETPAFSHYRGLSGIRLNCKYAISQILENRW